MRLLEKSRAETCYPIGVMAPSPVENKALHRPGPKSRRDRENLLIKNSILYCIRHPEYGSGGLCADAWTTATFPTAG
jgi:hypothetical protein